MTVIRISTFLLMLCIGVLRAQQADSTQVSVLGYHELSDGDKNTEMRIITSKFRKQMEAIKALGLSVISMEDFIAWKKGQKTIPERSIVITFDDGWKSVYTEAFPVLRELGYPFHLFLYKSYVDGGGRALTTQMIKEMMNHGGSIGCHSYTHPLPSMVKGNLEKGPEHFQAYLKTEMLRSKEFLEKHFETKINTYAFPGGFHTPEMLAFAEEAGYEAMFTVNFGKVRIADASETLNRYIILGTHDTYFTQATNFVGATNANSVRGAAIPVLPFPVSPLPGSTVERRLPVISADLSTLEGIDMESLKLFVGGFGEVDAVIDPETKLLSWQVTRPLRLPTCDVTLRYRLLGNTSYETPAKWTFLIDLEAAYIPARVTAE